MSNPPADAPSPSPRRPHPFVFIFPALVAIGAALLVIFMKRPAASSAPATPPSSTADAAPRLIDPAAIDQILESIALYRRQNQPAQAQAVLTSSLAQYPQEQRLYLAGAELMLDAQRPADAYAHYEKALAIGPRLPEHEFAAGTLANSLGRTERAIEHYSAAQTADASNPDYPLYLGLVQLKAGQNRAAEASLLRAIHLRDATPVAWASLADLALREGRLDVASNHIAKARALDPTSVPFRLIAARLLNRQAKAQEAAALLTPLGPEDRLTAPVLKLLGESFGLLNQPAQALAQYRAAVVAHPDDRDLALEAAQWARRAGAMSEARQFATRAQELGHPDAPALLSALNSSPTSSSPTSDTNPSSTTTASNPTSPPTSTPPAPTTPTSTTPPAKTTDATPAAPPEK